MKGIYSFLATALREVILNFNYGLLYLYVNNTQISYAQCSSSPGQILLSASVLLNQNDKVSIKLGGYLGESLKDPGDNYFECRLVSVIEE